MAGISILAAQYRQLKDIEQKLKDIESVDPHDESSDMEQLRAYYIREWALTLNSIIVKSRQDSGEPGNLE